MSITLDTLTATIEAMHEGIVKDSSEKIDRVKYSKEFTLEGTTTRISVTMERVLKKPPFEWRNLFRAKKIEYIDHAQVSVSQDDERVMDIFYNYFKNKKSGLPSPFDWQFKSVNISMITSHRLLLNP